MDPRQRFTETVDDYRRTRPRYPEALIDWIVQEAGCAPGDTVVDVGCGTGISTRQLAARGLNVIGADPNPDMLAAAREEPAPSRGSLRYLQTDGEALEVGVARVKAIVGGQSFHWLDLDRAFSRFSELLEAAGRVIAFWNLRDHHDPFVQAYDALIMDHCPEYTEVGAEHRARAVAAHPRVYDLREASFPHEQRLAHEAFFGRLWSSSYVRHSVAEPAAFDDEAGALFDAWQRDGTVTLRYQSRALSFTVA